MAAEEAKNVESGVPLKDAAPPPPVSEKPAPPVSEKPAPPISEKLAPPVSEKPAPPVTEKPAPPEPAKDVAEEKAVIPRPWEEKEDEAKSLAIVDKVTDPPPTGKSSSTSSDRDAVLTRVETEKRMSLIKAWEENEKAKSENKSVKKMSSITAWENSKKASVEAELKKIEECLEKKKAEYIEKMNNKIAMIHKEAEEKRAMVEAKRGEDVLKAEEMAAKYRATGHGPKKLLGCF